MHLLYGPTIYRTGGGTASGGTTSGGMASGGTPGGGMAGGGTTGGGTAGGGTTGGGMAGAATGAPRVQRRNAGLPDELELATAHLANVDIDIEEDSDFPVERLLTRINEQTLIARYDIFFILAFLVKCKWVSLTNLMSFHTRIKGGHDLRRRDVGLPADLSRDMAKLKMEPIEEEQAEEQAKKKMILIRNILEVESGLRCDIFS
jgi:hypothetical protein